MRFFKVFILIFLFQISAFGQEDYVIKPGFGLDELHIDMNANNIIQKLGEPEHIRSFTEAKSWVESLGHPLKNMLEFDTDFDTAYYYDWGSSSIDAPAPVFAIFAKKNKVVFIRLNSSFYKKKWCKFFRIGEDSNIGFKSKLAENVGIYSKPDNIIDISNNSSDYKYYAFYGKGVGLTYYKNKLTTIDIFKPINK